MTPDQLRDERDRLGLSQAGLAKALGVTRITVWKWEAGLHAVPEMAVKLMALLQPMAPPG